MLITNTLSIQGLIVGLPRRLFEHILSLVYIRSKSQGAVGDDGSCLLPRLVLGVTLSGLARKPVEQEIWPDKRVDCK